MDDRRQVPSLPGPLDELLAGGGSVVLDGGLATELEAQGADLSDALWSARLLVEDPGAIVRAHLAFFRAGAQLATTASYQATFEGFARRGLDHEAAAGLMRRSVELAREARALALAEGGGQPANVFWAPSAGTTMTTSVFQGTILAGDAVGGSITFTGGTLVGRALANVAVTLTTTSVIGR